MKSSANSRVSVPKLIGLVVVVVVLLLLPLIIDNPYIIHLCIMSFIFIVLGMTFSMQFSTGLITLGAAAFYAIGAYASTLLSLELGMSFWLALPLATVITAIIALGFGTAIVRHAGVPFVIMTLLFNMLVVEAAGQTEALGGWGGFVLIPTPSPIGPIEFTTKIPYYYLMLSLLLLIILIFYALYSSRIGRAWRAIRLSTPLAETLGINPFRYRLLAFVVASSAAGAIGSFYAHYFQTITPQAFGGWTSIFTQLYPVLGGLEFYILGPALGATLMIFVPEYLRVAKEIEPIITGTLLLLIIIFFPGGILGTILGIIKKEFPRLGLASISDRMAQIRDRLLSSNKK